MSEDQLSKEEAFARIGKRLDEHYLHISPELVSADRVYLQKHIEQLFQIQLAIVGMRNAQKQ